MFNKVFFQVFKVSGNTDHGSIVGEKLGGIREVKRKVKWFDGLADLRADI